MRYRFCDFKGPRILIGRVISLKTNRATSGYISLIRVRSSVAHPTASRREIRDRRASLITPFPSQASPFSSLTSLSLSLANFRDCRRLSLITAAVASAASSTAIHFRIYAHTRLIADYRVYESACFAKLRCYRQDFTRLSNYVCMDSLHFIHVTFSFLANIYVRF